MPQLAENQVVRVRKMGPRIEDDPERGWLIGTVLAFDSPIAAILMPSGDTLCLLVADDGRKVEGLDGSEWEVEQRIARSGEVDRVQP
jgi:hypothetical protein